MVEDLCIFSGIFAYASKHYRYTVTPCKDWGNREKEYIKSISEEYIRFVANTSVPQAMAAKEIEREFVVLDDLETLQECIRTGSWNNSNLPDYKQIQDELYFLEISSCEEQE